MRQIQVLCIVFILFSAWSCRSDSPEAEEAPPLEFYQPTDPNTPRVVFVTGDEEYRSEESMPMLARILKNRYGFNVEVAYSVTDGFIDPNRRDNIAGLEALENADMMVMFTRFRNLPDDQLQYILDFAESGRPMAGFRTSTHAFQYGESHAYSYLDEEWPRYVFGLPWISHFGSEHSTGVFLSEENRGHPVLNGVDPFYARSWLYDASELSTAAQPLLIGRAIEGDEPDGDYFGDPHVVAWTKLYEGENGTSRVFFTTLGHPYDFNNLHMRRTAIQGIFWALGLEDRIPQEGLNVDVIGFYNPNPAGVDQFKQNIRPGDIFLRID